MEYKKKEKGKKKGCSRKGAERREGTYLCQKNFTAYLSRRKKKKKREKKGMKKGLRRGSSSSIPLLSEEEGEREEKACRALSPRPTLFLYSYIHKR